MTLDQFYRAVGGTAAEAAPRLGGADATRRFLRLFPLDDSFPRLSEALGRGDVQTAFRAAHTLKGVAANLGLERLRRRPTGGCWPRLRSWNRRIRQKSTQIYNKIYAR